MKVNVLVDSSVWIEFFTEGPKAKKVMDFVVDGVFHNNLIYAIFFDEAFEEGSLDSLET